MTRLEPHPDVLDTRLPDGRRAVTRLDVGGAWRLNASAGALWEALAGGAGVEGAAAALAERWGLPGAEARAHAERFRDRALEAGLLVPRPSGEPGSADG